MATPAPVPATAPAMTPARMRECLQIIGWTQRELAEELNIDDRTVRLQWIVGKKPIPPEIAAWLERLVAAHLSRPTGWTRHPMRADRAA